MRSSKGRENDQQLFSKVYVWVLFVSSFYCLLFQESVPWFLGTLKNYSTSLSLQGWPHKGWVCFFVKILEAVNGGSQCVVFLSSVLLSEAMVSRRLDHVICAGWGICNTVCKLAPKFPWKFNVVLDSCGSENFEKRGQWAQESEIRVIWPLRNLKAVYDEKGDFFVGFRMELRWPLAQASLKFRKCICHSVYTCFAFCLFTPSFFVTKIVLFNNLTQYFHLY
jgi:hypothetical protein